LTTLTLTPAAAPLDEPYQGEKKSECLVQVDSSDDGDEG
jgi:hypothetical protein